MTSVSIIVRTKNEETWIKRCLQACRAQSINDIEIVLVDNNSQDSTVSIAREFIDKLVLIDQYLPGHALNQGIRVSSGDFIVMLSGHCVPSSPFWLSNLLQPFQDLTIGAVYGRQLATPQSSPSDKRDLAIVFGPESRVQAKDPFFHNANSAIRRSTWDDIPFNEKVTNIEDRIFAQELLARQFKIFYQSEASVYHWHGIHHGGNISRAISTAHIVDQITTATSDHSWDARGPNPSINVVGFLTSKYPLVTNGKPNLLSHTLKQLTSLDFLSHTYIKCPLDISHLLHHENSVTFLESNPDASAQSTLSDELQFFVNYLDLHKVYPDFILLMLETYPLRSINNIHQAYASHLEKHHETTAFFYTEDRFVLDLTSKSNFRVDSDHFMRRKDREHVQVDLPGYCLITTPARIRNSTVYQDPVQYIQIPSSFNGLPVRSSVDFSLVKSLLL